ncbi:hypothetical protein MYCTH_2305912, partial [Thermothelomyces thermophilus ATCC 42464]
MLCKSQSTTAPATLPALKQSSPKPKRTRLSLLLALWASSLAASVARPASPRSVPANGFSKALCADRRAVTVFEHSNGLEWDLSENSINPEQAHSQTYHTAFGFEHSKRPLFMRVEVEGKLRGRSRQMKHDLLKFSPRSAEIYIDGDDFARHVEFKKPLDQIARSLDMAMQMENIKKIPVEMPDQMPAQFTRENITQNSPSEAQMLLPQQRPVSLRKNWEQARARKWKNALNSKDMSAASLNNTLRIPFSSLFGDSYKARPLATWTPI